MTANTEEKTSGSGWLESFANNLLTGGTQVLTAKYTKPETTVINTQSNGGFKLGNTEISTSTILWTVGGTIGFIVFAGILRKVMK